MGFVITKTKCIVAGAAALIVVGGFLLLLPKVQDGISRPIVVTRNTINRLGAGLAGFRDDFGDYPPSDKEHMAARPYGYQNLAYYLCGPDGQGWGGRAGGAMPFGGSNEQIFGPYFEKGGEGSGNHPAAGVSDAFRPPKPILYFRAEPTEEPMFDAADNPLDPTGREGFASQEHFEMLVRRADGQRNVPPGWVRDDYLLISAGLDRVFGYAVQDAESGLFRPAQPDEKEKAWCDDVTNFVVH
ncbi:MAG: hypothetical protein WBC59_08665 [Phycisphaerae bacterium]